jgi:hypothetical protein
LKGNAPNSLIFMITWQLIFQLKLADLSKRRNKRNVLKGIHADFHCVTSV